MKKRLLVDPKNLPKLNPKTKVVFTQPVIAKSRRVNENGPMKVERTFKKAEFQTSWNDESYFTERIGIKKYYFVLKKASMLH